MAAQNWLDVVVAALIFQQSKQIDSLKNSGRTADTPSECAGPSNGFGHLDAASIRAPLSIGAFHAESMKSGKSSARGSATKSVESG